MESASGRKPIPCIKSKRVKRKINALQTELDEIDDDLREHLRHPDRGTIDNVISLRVPEQEVDFISKNLEQRSLRVQQQGYPSVGWPKATHSRCWWCRGRISGHPCIMPVAFNSKDMVYECEGFFDTWSCVLRYMMEQGTKLKLGIFLRQVLRVPGFVSGYIVAAPHWKMLKSFGGSLSRSEFQRLLTRGITIDVYTKMVMPLRTVQWTSVYARLSHVRSQYATNRDKQLARMDIEDGIFFKENAGSAQPHGQLPTVPRQLAKLPTTQAKRHKAANTNPSKESQQEQDQLKLRTAAARFRVQQLMRHENRKQSNLDRYLKP